MKNSQRLARSSSTYLNHVLKGSKNEENEKIDRQKSAREIARTAGVLRRERYGSVAALRRERDGHPAYAMAHRDPPIVRQMAQV